MSEQELLYKPQAPSFGGDVADALATIKSHETGQPYSDSMNPNGNPFEGQEVPQIITTLYSRHPDPNTIEILGHRLDDFYGVKPEQPTPPNVPPEYTQAKHQLAAIQESLEKPQNQ